MPTIGDAVAVDRGLDELIGLFRLLSDKTRLNILLTLAEGERNVTSLCEELQISQPTMSHHLGVLRSNHLIANRREGKQVFYNLQSMVAPGGEQGLKLVVEKFTVKLAKRGAS